MGVSGSKFSTVANPKGLKIKNRAKFHKKVSSLSMKDMINKAVKEQGE